jgi:hypothetical protein
VRAQRSYRAKFIDTGSFAPVKHFMVGVFALAFGLEVRAAFAFALFV